jgi:hypothetical protein
MLFTLSIALCLLWAFGVLSSFTMGGLVHILPPVAVAVLMLRLVRKSPEPATIPARATAQRRQPSGRRRRYARLR